MSITQIIPLGQEQAVEPQPITEMPAQVYAGLQTFWNEAYELCTKRFTQAQCRSLLGYRPIIMEKEESPFGLRWYIWLIGGVVIGKVML